MKLGDKITVTGTKLNPSSIDDFNKASSYPFDAVLIEADEASTDKFYIDTPFYDKNEGDALCALSHFNYTKN